MNRVDDDGEVRTYCDYPNCEDRAKYIAGAGERKLDVCKKHKDVAHFISELINLRLMG